MPKNNLVISSVVWLVFFAVVLSAGCDTPRPRFECSDGIGCIDVASGEPIKIGVLQALSGKVAPLGFEQVRGIDLAIDKRHGKILDHSILLQTEDAGCTGEGGANAALRVIADPQTVAILGTTCSGEAATASKAMSDAGLSMISGNNSAPYLTAIAGKRAPNWQPGYFRTASNEENSGKAAAKYAFYELGVRKAATIHDGDIYTRGLAEGFGQAFQKFGGEIVLSASVSKGDQEMLPVLTAVMNSNAQLLFFPLFQPEGNRVLLQARKTAGFEKIILMSDGALIESSFIEAVKDEGKGMYFVGPSRPGGPQVDALAKDYEAKFNISPSASYYLNAFDAARLLMEAIEKVAIKEPDGSLHIGRQALRNALYATRGFKGVSGSLTCDEFGDCAIPVFNILRLDDPAAGLEGLQSNVMFTYTYEK
ncbi:MAG: branched-chain amino acid ABC transporter substrate-binding protein [Deltaproteobacteria bacterium]|nr:branched-chain amino acid ABC transporter substrate-binding protein [Deltaproteobacteria bacterium]